MQKNNLLLRCTWNILQDSNILHTLDILQAHILGHKSNRSKFKKTEIISSIFSNHNTMRLHINYKNKTVRNTNTWRLNNTYKQVTEEIKREIKKFLETNDNENTRTQNLRDAAKAVLRGKFRAIQSYFEKQDNIE